MNHTVERITYKVEQGGFALDLEVNFAHKRLSISNLNKMRNHEIIEMDNLIESEIDAKIAELKCHLEALEYGKRMFTGTEKP